MIDKTKKSNRKCENCEHWKDYKLDKYGMMGSKCEITNEPKYYYQKCKNFEWSSRKEYKGGEDE